MASIRPHNSDLATVSVLFSEPKIPQSEVAEAYGYEFFVSVLFSEPKIPQLPHPATCCNTFDVSVLFSEPKIPQFCGASDAVTHHAEFQCSSASRKFLNDCVFEDIFSAFSFQCSSASRKFLNLSRHGFSGFGR